MPDETPARLVPSRDERRRVTLAAMFAELRLSRSTRAVVSDDPLAALDHERRALVARRRVDEAATRQVFVWTHGLPVAREPRRLAGSSIACDTLTLRSPKGFGVPSPSLPPDEARGAIEPTTSFARRNACFWLTSLALAANRRSSSLAKSRSQASTFGVISACHSGGINATTIVVR
jgi:hypothetical protein